MSVSYTLRLPDDLKRLIDSAAKSGGVSTAQLVVDACWKYLERKPSVPQTAAVPVAQPIKGNAAMAAFMANVAMPAPTLITDAPPEPCKHTEWAEDGEQYACRLHGGHKGKCAPGVRLS